MLVVAEHQIVTLARRVNQRQHRVLGRRPVDRADSDQAAMAALPPVAQVAGWRLSIWLSVRGWWA